jgi:tetratricopeptide (TPR) repeat protein
MSEGGGNVVFESLRSRAQQAVDAGRLETAAALIEKAVAWAREHGTVQQLDHALCNRAAVNIQLGKGEAELPKLREILLRSGDLGNCRLAAYHISVHYQYAKNFEKSLFYARIACDRAESLGIAESLATSLNQAGNALLGASFIEEACREYERALELMPGECRLSRALVLDNLGYGRILQKRFPEGYACLYESLRILRRLRVERYQVIPRLDLCFAHLETGRCGSARRHGLAALRSATEGGMIDGIKNALYLLGEAANQSGDVELAQTYFTRLQREFYPGETYLPGFLLAVDIRKFVNLHA